MRKNTHYKLQTRTKLSNGKWVGWDDVKSKDSHYKEEQHIPKKSEITKWFREEYAPSEGLKIDWQAGFYWGCCKDVTTCEYRVVNRKDETEVKL